MMVEQSGEGIPIQYSICIIEDCNTKIYRRDLCVKHFTRWYKYGSPYVVLRCWRAPVECELEGCKRKYLAKGLCSRHYDMRRKYNVSDEWMMGHIDSACDICEITEEESYRPLMVDHDHKTGKIRGILCNNCNLALGLLSDDPNRAQKLIDYILSRR